MIKSWVLVSGGSGLVGKSLCLKLNQSGYLVRVLSRKKMTPWEGVDDVVQWSPATGNLPLEAFQDTIAVVHLAGATIAKYWTGDHRRRILHSRTQSSQTLIDAIAQLPENGRPSAFISASAVGWYPSSDKIYSESEPPGEGFVAEVVQAWEERVSQAEMLGCRTVKLRMGLVLTTEGGVLGSMKPMFSLGLGSAIGTGDHWCSWIHIGDLTRLILWSIRNQDVTGAVNAVSPNPVQNKVFSAAFARALCRPFILPNVPTWALQAVFGKMSRLLLSSNRIVPTRALKLGFQFQHPQLKETLKDLFGK